jgi:hypothetical protein
VPPLGEPLAVGRQADDVVHRGVAELVGVERPGLIHRVRLVDLELALQDVADPPDVLQVVRDDPDADQVGDLGQQVLVLRALTGDLLDEAVDVFVRASIWMTSRPSPASRSVIKLCSRLVRSL